MPNLQAHSDKLGELGFRYKYGIKEILDGSIDCAVRFGFLDSSKVIVQRRVQIKSCHLISFHGPERPGCKIVKAFYNNFTEGYVAKVTWDCELCLLVSGAGGTSIVIAQGLLLAEHDVVASFP